MPESLVMDPASRARGITPEYVEAVGADRGAGFDRRPRGSAEPRLFTPPLRPLTPETSLGFEVILFAAQILGVELYPWQKALLIRALELRPDGRYRFRRIIVLVARQQGKTTLASVLAAWWLFVDSLRHPDRVPPVKFRVVGVAQSLDIAREPWNAVKQWCDPDPETDEESELALATLQSATAKVLDTNGKESIQTRKRPHYEIRAAKNARGKSAARVIFDELREQVTWAAWNAVSQITKSFFNGQLWGISNAGDVTAVVLNKLRPTLLGDMAAWAEYVESGIQSIEDFANGRDTSMGLFEWSAPEGCALDDVDGILQANPSIGYGELTVEDCISDARSMDEPDYRTEVLCQVVPSLAKPYLDGEAWSNLADPESEIAVGSRMVLGVAVAGNRSWTSIGVAGARADGRVHVEHIAGRTSNLWVIPFLEKVRARTGITEVAIQSKGVPSAELVQPLKDAGFVVHEISGSLLLNLAGRMSDRVADRSVAHRAQPSLDFAVSTATVTFLSKMPVWDIHDSPVDVSPVLAVNLALYALESAEAPKPKSPAPPPLPAQIITRDDVAEHEENLALAPF